MAKNSALHSNPTFGGFSYKIPLHYQGRNLPKNYDKFTNFFSTVCINIRSFSMSFGSKIYSGFGDSCCQTFDFRFSLLKLTFFIPLNLKACKSRTTKHFGPKTHFKGTHFKKKLLTLMQANEKELVNLS